MERLSITPRTGWQSQVEALGFSIHTQYGEIYWDERACYRFDPQEIAALETATNEVEKMCIAVVDNVVQFQRYGELNIPECAWQLIEESWQRGDKNLIGRFDFSYDGIAPPKLLEYNADTPTSLPETSLVQKQWLEQVRPGCQQFNHIHASLVAAWPHFNAERIHLTYRETCEEELVNVNYLADTVIQAGLTPKLLPINKVLSNGQYFFDTEKTVITTLFKLFPWERLFNDVYRNNAHQTTMQIIEPIWKMILSNKTLLVLLWEMFPDHPNLLPAYFDRQRFKGDYVEKPLFGRVGENVSLYSSKGNIISDGIYKNGPFIYQQAHLAPNFDGNYPIIGSWVIAGEAAGIGVREDASPISNDDSRFVPHFF